MVGTAGCSKAVSTMVKRVGMTSCFFAIRCRSPAPTSTPTWPCCGARHPHRVRPASTGGWPALSSWYRYLIDAEITMRNPVTAVQRAPVNRDHSATVGLTVAEVRAFLRAVDAAVNRWATAPRCGAPPALRHGRGWWLSPLVRVLRR